MEGSGQQNFLLPTNMVKALDDSCTKMKDNSISILEMAKKSIKRKNQNQPNASHNSKEYFYTGCKCTSPLNISRYILSFYYQFPNCSKQACENDAHHRKQKNLQISYSQQTFPSFLSISLAPQQRVFYILLYWDSPLPLVKTSLTTRMHSIVNEHQTAHEHHIKSKKRTQQQHKQRKNDSNAAHIAVE